MGPQSRSRGASPPSRVIPQGGGRGALDVGHGSPLSLAWPPAAFAAGNGPHDGGGAAQPPPRAHSPAAPCSGLGGRAPPRHCTCGGSVFCCPATAACSAGPPSPRTDAQVGAGVGKPLHGLGGCIWMPLVNGTGNSPVSGTADPRSSQTGQVIRGLR